MSQAQINTSILSWARERAGMAVDELAAKFHVKPEKLAGWESGQIGMTFLQAKDYADKTHIPFGYLFLKAPPQDELLIPDLRTVEGRQPEKPSAELIDMVKIMRERQEWLRDYKIQHLAEPVAVIGRFNSSTPIAEIVADMRRELGIAESNARGNWDVYYRTLVRAIEQLGIIVMREGFIGHYSRALNVDEFRGFAMVDTYAPLIFVNHADSYGARLFTLIHELAHIWLGQTGVSNGDQQSHHRIESLCNAVAAEFLVPEAELLRLWQADSEDLHSLLKQLESHFHVSTWVLAIRAKELGLLTGDQSWAYIQSRKQDYEKKGGGATYYRTRHAQLSDQFAKAVVADAMSGQLMLRDAGLLLGVKPANIAKFAKELGI